MKNIHYGKFVILFVLLLSITNNAYAVNLVTVEDGYIKASIPGSDITAAFMTINNSSDKAITLQKISGSLSDRIEIHEHSMTGGMMRMRQVDNITVDPHSKIILQPSGLHLMIFALKKPITEKEIMPLTLYFSNGTKINIQLPVRRFK
ncbi:copper chaperone PCu(A)C [Colwellia psychrerythraea]|uniref:Copper chaperone PCu(A)C n=1 Tax=Colwellia psychrerythraea TaxID=28229 RepID=A0A099L1F7_COLPS|nr:copper chaperone PCu(A)C [Colwellia psychrerythraea]KGJ96661.1 protein of unknown function DUF461 [Colwellia psychrerythraea]